MADVLRVSGTCESLILGFEGNAEMTRKMTALMPPGTRRSDTLKVKREAVSMLFEESGDTAPQVMERLELPSVSLLYRWKKELLIQRGPGPLRTLQYPSCKPVRSRQR